MPPVWIVRHGESAANAGGRTFDQASIPLTEDGRRQAETVASAIYLRPALIVVSTYLRSAQTAEPLLARYPGVPVEVWDVHEFTYLDALDCAGTTYAERASRRDRFWTRCDPGWSDGADCESFTNFLARVRRFQEALRRIAFNETAVVFSHGHFIQALLWLAQTPDGDMLSFDRFRRATPIANCAVIRVPRF